MNRDRDSFRKFQINDLVPPTGDSSGGEFEDLRRDYLARCEFIIRSLQEEAASKDEQIAALEERLDELSLELALSKAPEDDNYGRLNKQQRESPEEETVVEAVARRRANYVPRRNHGGRVQRPAMTPREVKSTSPSAASEETMPAPELSLETTPRKATQTATDSEGGDALDDDLLPFVPQRRGGWCLAGLSGGWNLDDPTCK